MSELTVVCYNIIRIVLYCVQCYKHWQAHFYCMDQLPPQATLPLNYGTNTSDIE